MINSLEFLVCPECKSPLRQNTSSEIECIKCENKYVVKTKIIFVYISACKDLSVFKNDGNLA